MGMYFTSNVYNNGSTCEYFVIKKHHPAVFCLTSSTTYFRGNYYFCFRSTLCPICRKKCTVRNTRVLHFSFDNSTNEDEFMVMVDLQQFKNGMKELLQQQDNEILTLNKQLGYEKKKRLSEKKKSDQLVLELNQWDRWTRFFLTKMSHVDSINLL